MERTPKTPQSIFIQGFNRFKIHKKQVQARIGVLRHFLQGALCLDYHLSRYV